MSPRQSIVFLHPDLGIGGAERLIIDAAVGLQKRGHKVTIFTSHCDKTHCFDEARDGTIDVRVHGASVFPAHIFGRFSILCAILRQIHLVLSITIFSDDLKFLRPTVFFVDQLSACVPLLHWLAPEDTRILFYVHFPDKLLATRRSLVKRLYRIPFDWLESWTTGSADALVVNSEFTRGVFGDAFPRLRGRRPRVVYPCVDTAEKLGEVEKIEGPLWGGKKVILSINRFERKKEVERAIRAFAALGGKGRGGSRLVIAGGYDPRVSENVSYHRDLAQLAESLGLNSATTKTIVTALSVPSDISVLFLLSVPASLKTTLLHAARLLVYTPTNEHFGIVPLEAMLAGVPVLATNTGGPLETVQDGVTGWLRPADDVKAWSDVMGMVLGGMDDREWREMGERGQRRVRGEFSEVKMAERLEGEIERMVGAPRQKVLNLLDLAVSLVGVAIFGYALLAVGRRTWDLLL